MTFETVFSLLETDAYAVTGPGSFKNGFYFLRIRSVENILTHLLVKTKLKQQYINVPKFA